MVPSGPFRVGFKEFHSSELENDCSIFYPAASDNSGQFGVPLFTYGEEQAKGFAKVLDLQYPHVAKFATDLIK